MKGIGLLVVTALFTTVPSDGRTPVAGPLAKENAAVTVSASVPQPALAKQDPADSLYREARQALSRGDYTRAAQLFARVAERYPKSPYAGESLYYQAFSMYRSGGTEKLRSAREVLSKLRAAYPSVAGRGDVASLRTRICGELARQGDERCAAEVSSAAIVRDAGCPREDDENDERMAALNALLQMDASRAMPILSKVLERRDACWAPLRRRAVFLVSQKHTPETADILLRIARNDPDREVREQAVFWLSQVSDERAVDMLQDILRGSRDEGLQDKALFALSQHRSGRGAGILREFAAREGPSDDLRGKAIFWLGQRRSSENTEFLRSLYSRLRNDELKDKILFSLSQQRGVGNDKWLMDIAVNPSEPLELRKKALFWAGQTGVSMDQLVSVYSRMREREMKEQMIFVFSQRHSSAAVDKLLDIARNDSDPELRKKAIFWLGQSRDPRVQQFLLDLINR